jgi:hypothetical protein
MRFHLLLTENDIKQVLRKHITSHFDIPINITDELKLHYSDLALFCEVNIDTQPTSETKEPTP